MSSTAYHELADRRSTLSMLSLFAEVWPDYPQYAVATCAQPPSAALRKASAALLTKRRRRNACGTVLGQAIASAAKL